MFSPVLSESNLAFFTMTAAVAGALFIAITIALRDEAQSTRRPDRAAMMAFTCPVLVIGLDLFPFMGPTGSDSGDVIRTIIGLLLLLSLFGLVYVVIALPVINKED